ncbi:MAG: PAS domain S-box protein [Desulfomonilaceae bacterium]
MKRTKTRSEDQLIKEVCDLSKRVAELQDWKAEHVSIEESLRESESLFRTLVEKAAVGVYLIQNSRVEYVNQAAADIFGCDVSELSGKRSKLPIFADDWPTVEENLRKRVTGEVDTINYQFRGVRRDGVIVWLEAFGSSMEYKGRPAVIGTLTDITDRVHAERESRLQRQRFEILSEHAPYGLAMVSKDGEFKYVNPKFKEIFGYDLQDILNGRQWFNMAFPDPIERHTAISAWIEDIEKSGSGDTRTRTFRVTCKDGSEKTILFGPVRLTNSDHLMTCEDITESYRIEELLKKSEAKLRASHAQFQAFMDNGPIIAFMRDNQGRYVYVNRQFLSNNNLSSAQVLGKTANEIFPEEMARKATKEDLNVMESNATVASVESLVGHRGVQRDWWLIRFPVKDADGRRFLGGVGLDLTERIKAQRALEVSEARFRYIYENLPIMVHSADRDEVIRNVNRKWLSHMGYNREEVVGRSLDDFIFRDPDPVAERSLLRSQLWAKGIASNVQRQYVKKDGSIIDVVLDSIIMDDPVLGMVSLTTVHDITGLKQAEEQIKKSLKEKEVLLSEINHRVKNNLQVISSLLKLQSRQVSQASYSHMLHETQNRLYTMALIHEKLYQSGNVADLEVESYLKSLVANLFYLYGAKSSQIEPTIDAQGLHIGADKADPLGLIANELVSNCLKYAFPDGRQGIIRISLTLDSNEFQFTVSDNGVGLREDFDPFNVKTLGLHLVHTLVQQLQGVMTVKRTEGTEFRIRFPS